MKSRLKDLNDVSGEPGMTTIKELSELFSMTTPRITEILNGAEIQPVGKIRRDNELTGRKSVGKPSMAFNKDAAVEAINRAVGVKQTELAS